MHINKKILSIALVLSLHGTVVCMEQAELESKQHIEDINHYMSEENTKTRKEILLPLAEWLTDQRSVHSNDDDWSRFYANNHMLFKSFATMIAFPKELGITPENMINTIMNRAKTLQPYQSALMLVDTIDQDLLVLYHARSK